VHGLEVLAKRKMENSLWLSFNTKKFPGKKSSYKIFPI
jgi:hypothetical protein